MNTEILQLEKLSEAFHASIRQLLQEDTLTPIDRDLLKHQCLLMYDRILTLSSAEKVIPTPVIVEKTEPKEEVVKPLPEIPVIPVTQSLFDENFTLNDLAKNAETHVDVLPPTETEIQNTVIDTILDQQHFQPEPITSIPNIELTLHEKIAQTMEPKGNLIEKLSLSIPSLKNAINVNLKIALVNELFNDNTVEYVKAIDKLNSCENIHEAMRYFNELKHQYTWESENHNVKELEQLLAKRYNS